MDSHRERFRLKVAQFVRLTSQQLRLRINLRKYSNDVHPSTVSTLTLPNNLPVLPPAILPRVETILPLLDKPFLPNLPLVSTALVHKPTTPPVLAPIPLTKSRTVLDTLKRLTQRVEQLRSTESRVQPQTFSITTLLSWINLTFNLETWLPSSLTTRRSNFIDRMRKRQTTLMFNSNSVLS